MRPTMHRLLIASAAMLACATPAFAAPPSSGLESAGRAMSDAELVDMRGKFISPGNVSYFGIQMQTQWQGSDGVTTAATLLFSVDFLNGAGNPAGATPVLAVGYNRSGDPSLDVAGPAALPVGGLNSAQGAVQTQQIAGSDNMVRNDMRVMVVPSSAVTLTTSGMAPVAAGQSHTFDDGDTLQVTVGTNQVGLALTNGGSAEQVRQNFDGSMGQAAQHVLLSSDNNTVHNSMGIVIGYDQLGEASRISVENALSTMKTGF